MTGMSKKSEVKTRKGQLIHTFGPGAMQVNKSGISMIACGLDYWFTQDGTTKSVSPSVITKLSFNDERLEKKLGVNHFRMPPNAIELDNGQKVYSPIPASRFPYWHICSNTNCQRLVEISSIDEQEARCNHCKAPVYQSRFVSSCSNGHLQDFPWIDWLNTHNNSSCESSCEIALIGTGSASVAGIKVKCLTHSSRPVSLAGIFKTESENGIITSSTLQEKGIICLGHSPWLGCNSFEPCSQPLVAALRQATNIYFSKTDSSILIPNDGSDKDLEIEEVYEKLPISTKSSINGSGDVNQKISFIEFALNNEFSREEIASFLDKQEQKDQIDQIDCAETDISYKFQEYQHFFLENKVGVLVTKPLSIGAFESWFQSFFSAVTQVKELTVTNAFYGFDRIQPQNSRTIDSYKNSLRKSVNKESNWLPAVKVYGEGIFLGFNAKKVRQWSEIFAKNPSFKTLANKMSKSPLLQNLGELSPEFLLIHTFAHLLINQLIFDCGYSTASLRERLYVNNSLDMEMCGVLIYTASGDSEGSLGGLVRMAKDGILEPIIKKAIESSNWCSSDPICREVGDNGGQGPAGMNLAACHNCALLPETSCEVFNSLLDRGTVTSKDLSNAGYFDELLNDSKTS